MMLPTHALGGMALALPLTLGSPDLAGPALVAGFLGGILPDLDLYFGHRKTLHYPVYYSVLAVPTVALAVLVPTVMSVVAAFLLLGAAIHCLADVFGGGLELRPWEATSDRAVYNHYSGHWMHPRRWVQYDGAPEDFLVSVLLGTLLVVAIDGPLQLVIVSTVAVAGVYAVVRRNLPSVATSVVRILPGSIRSALPARYLENHR